MTTRWEEFSMKRREQWGAEQHAVAEVAGKAFSVETEAYYAELARQAEAGELTLSGPVLTGDAAAQAGRDMLMRSTGTDNIEDALRVVLGNDEVLEGLLGALVSDEDVVSRIRRQGGIN